MQAILPCVAVKVIVSYYRYFLDRKKSNGPHKIRRNTRFLTAGRQN
jgi:hypothetical protein